MPNFLERGFTSLTCVEGKVPPVSSRIAEQRWYRMEHFTSWDEFVGKLRDTFKPHDYELTLMDEIGRRTDTRFTGADYKHCVNYR
ncbi:hypothetical protein JTB14_020470 [Gonioctena quinquepunctata]|nr:hypothetical protein JTB14_020470 [Gonioctena quinquepunctata]